MHASILRYFLEVARCGSIRKAAQRLFVASSAVNRQILQLEHELGTELFDRLPTGIRLDAADAPCGCNPKGRCALGLAVGK